MQTSRLADALDGFKQSLLVAQQNRRLREQEQSARAVHNAQIANFEAETQKILSPFQAASQVQSAYEQSRQAGTPFDFSAIGPETAINLGADNIPILSPFLADDNARAQAYLAAGKPLAPNDAFSLADRDAVAARNSEAEIQKIFATPVDTAAGAVTTLGVGDPRGSSIYGRDTEATASGRVINDLAAGRPVQPLAAATVLPASGAMTADGVTEFGPSVDPLGFVAGQKSTRNILESSLLEKQKFKQGVERFKTLIAENPYSFGAVGRVRGAAQDISGVADQAAQAFGFESLEESKDEILAEITAAARREGGSVDAEFLAQFDPSISQVDQIANLMAYWGASALAAQSGRSLSNQDFKTFRQIIGNPHSLLATPQKMQAKVQQLESLVDSQIAVERHALGLPPLPAAASTTAKRYIYDASGNLLEQP